MHRALFIAGLAMAAMLGSGLAQAEPPEVEVDRVALAAVLIQDGHFDRASQVLDEVDPENDKRIDLPRYYMLRGLLALKRSNHAAAAGYLDTAMLNGQTDPMAQVFLAQARFALNEYEGALLALFAAGEAADKLAASHLMRAQCYWRTDRRGRAYQALQWGLKWHPGELELLRHKVLLLIDMGLFHKAREVGNQLLDHPGAGPDDHVAIAEALRRGKQSKAAIGILEEARLRFPSNQQVLRQLARTYLDRNQTLTAGRLFHEAARVNPELMVEVAELYRRSGQLWQALQVNSQVQDQKAKIRQRLGLLIELERFEKAASLEPRLSRLGLLEDDSIRYALAYTYFKTGRLEKAETHAKRVLDPASYQKAIELHRAIDACRRSGWICE